MLSDLSDGLNYCLKTQVIDAAPTGTFLDRALFAKIAAKHKEGYKRKLADWIRDCITTWNCENNVASVCLDSLVHDGILGKERKLVGMYTDYPLKNAGNEREPEFYMPRERPVWVNIKNKNM